MLTLFFVKYHHSLWLVRSLRIPATVRRQYLHQKSLPDSQDKVCETGAAALEDIEEVETFEWSVKIGESKLRLHNNLLQGIEQQQIAMPTVRASPVQDTSGPDRSRNIAACPAPSRRNKWRNDILILNRNQTAVYINPPHKWGNLRPPERIGLPDQAKPDAKFDYAL
ncbi:hypothetical protein MMC31_005375, partial [Peltigera leucophlebia]|nr:hypothetical protein [Peltigera leucophlebia]